MKNKLALKIAGSLGLLVVLALVFMAPSILKKPDSTNSSQAAITYIDITDSGFVPADIKVTKGMTVTWRNTTDAPHQVASNPYPAHTDLPALYSTNYIQPTSEYSYTFTDAGTFGYHDYLHPEVTGQVTVLGED